MHPLRAFDPNNVLLLTLTLILFSLYQTDQVPGVQQTGLQSQPKITKIN